MKTLSKKLLTALAFTLGFALTLHLGSARADNCKDVLESNLYRCTFNVEGSRGPVTACMQFDASNTTEGKFSADFGRNTFQCSCQTKGNLTSPEFNEDKAFICGAAPSGDAMIGKASGSKIKSGEYLCNGSCSREKEVREAIFACELDPECEDVKEE